MKKLLIAAVVVLLLPVFAQAQNIQAIGGTVQLFSNWVAAATLTSVNAAVGIPASKTLAVQVKALGTQVGSTNDITLLFDYSDDKLNWHASQLSMYVSNVGAAFIAISNLTVNSTRWVRLASINNATGVTDSNVLLKIDAAAKPGL